MPDGDRRPIIEVAARPAEDCRVAARRQEFECLGLAGIDPGPAVLALLVEGVDQPVVVMAAVGRGPARSAPLRIDDGVGVDIRLFDLAPPA